MFLMGRVESRVAVLVAAVSALLVIACGGPTQFETIQTFESDKRIEFATATAEAIIAAGGDPATAGGVQVGAGSVAAQAQATAAAKATAAAEAGEAQEGAAVGTDAGSETEQVADFEVEIPDGPAQSGEVSISIADTDEFDPQFIKVTVGTTVTWENPRGSPSSASSIDGEAEQFDTGELWKSSFNREVCCGSHTFTVVGCHKYRSLFSGDTAFGAVCVVEE